MVFSRARCFVRFAENGPLTGRNRLVSRAPFRSLNLWRDPLERLG
jgi:hypothetical protein